MLFLITLAVTLVCVVVLKSVLRKVPWLFYLLCIAASVALVMSSGTPWASHPLMIAMRSGFIANSLFIIVMYIGVFPYGSKVRNYLAPIRAVLAIGACILVLGHIAHYFGSFIPRLFAGSLRLDQSVSMGAGLVLFALLLVLGITSFRAVRRALGGKNWLRLQRLSYVFYAFIYLHAMGMLFSSALGGGQLALTKVVVYTVIFGLYAVLRIARAVIDNREKQRAQQLRQEELDSQAVLFD